jgi:hypothetical protein
LPKQNVIKTLQPVRKSEVEKYKVVSKKILLVVVRKRKVNRSIVIHEILIATRCIKTRLFHIS